MKNCLLLPLVFLAAQLLAGTSAAPATPQDDEETVRISDSNIMFFYEAKADLPSPDENLARTFSAEYRDAQTEFAKVDLLKKLMPVIQRKIVAAGEMKEVMVRVSAEIPAYDFNRKGFSTGLSSETFIPFDAGRSAYAVVFKGIKSFSFLKLSEEEASKFQGKLAMRRDGHLEIYGTVVAAEEQSIGGYLRKVLFIRPVRLVYALQDGAPLGEITLPSTK